MCKSKENLFQAALKMSLLYSFPFYLAYTHLMMLKYAFQISNPWEKKCAFLNKILTPEARILISGLKLLTEDNILSKMVGFRFQFPKVNWYFNFCTKWTKTYIHIITYNACIVGNTPQYHRFSPFYAQMGMSIFECYNL